MAGGGATDTLPEPVRLLEMRGMGLTADETHDHTLAYQITRAVAAIDRLF